MADFYGGRKAALEDEDLQEEQVWPLMKVKEDSNLKTRRNFYSGPPSSSSSTWRSNATQSTTASGGHQESTVWVEPQQSSAPLDIPDWSKILKRNSNKNVWDDGCDAHNNDDNVRRKTHHGFIDNDDDDDDNEDGNEMVPPHEYLARRLATTQIASFSMCEGVGRTLKGRDLSKLRNAILTKTGFLE